MSNTQATADTRHDPRAIRTATDRLRWHCGKDAPRGWAAIALSVAAWADLSPTETEEVLGHFDPDPDPVPGKDWLPTARTLFTHCNWVGGCDAELSEGDGSMFCPTHRDAPLGDAIAIALRDDPVLHKDVTREEWEQR